MSIKNPSCILSFLLLLIPSTVRAQHEVLVPESYVERARSEGPILEISLNDAIRLALTNNLEIAIENFNEDLYRERILTTRGFYDPILRFGFGWNSTEIPSTSLLDAGPGISTRIFKNWVGSTGVRQNVPGGGLLDVNINSDRFTTNSSFSTINPRFGSSLELAFTQPLWRGFRETPTERQLKLYNLDTQISDSQFKQHVSEIVQQVENQYWELVFAIENHETRRQSVGLAVIQHKNNEKRVNIGVTAPIEITSSRAEVATREQDMIQSEVRIINAQNGLKRMVAPDPKGSVWNLTLIPTDRPEMRETRVTMQEAMEAALKRRPELEQIQLQIEQNGVDRKYYKKEGKPKLDLTLGLTSRGTSGDVFAAELFGSSPALMPNSPFFGNLGETWSQLLGFNYMAYEIGFSVEIPLRNRTSEGELAQAAITERRLLSQFKNQQQIIIVDVRNAYEEIQTQKKRLAAARLAGQLSTEQLYGENKRFQAGLSTNFEVLRFQRDLAEARVQELRALIDYQLALTALEKAMYTIVDDSDIVLARK